jgi:DNA-binding MarR family transcriptional regulator
VNGPIYTSDLNTNERVLMAVVRAAESLKRNQSSIFKNYGLSFPQYNVLRVLDASQNGRQRISEISRIMLIPVANMTGLAKRLERDGFLIRKSDKNDERVTILEITPKGKKTLKNIKRIKDHSIELILKDFSDKEKADLVNKLKKIITLVQKRF